MLKSLDGLRIPAHGAISKTQPGVCLGISGLKFDGLLISLGRGLELALLKQSVALLLKPGRIMWFLSIYLPGKS